MVFTPGVFFSPAAHYSSFACHGTREGLVPPTHLSGNPPSSAPTELALCYTVPPCPGCWRPFWPLFLVCKIGYTFCSQGIVTPLNKIKIPIQSCAKHLPCSRLIFFDGEAAKETKGVFFPPPPTLYPRQGVPPRPIFGKTIMGEGAW